MIPPSLLSLLAAVKPNSPLIALRAAFWCEVYLAARPLSDAPDQADLALKAFDERFDTFKPASEPYQNPPTHEPPLQPADPPGS